MYSDRIFAILAHKSEEIFKIMSKTTATKPTHYPSVEANPHFPSLEQEVLSYWKENKTFEQSVENRPTRGPNSTNNEYVFYDGPPFANGLPHHGHLLTGYVKDLFARYHTMKGERVERRFGWDCHGLPAEMAAEKELRVSGRKEITRFGIEKFNDHCRQSIMQYRDQWEWYVNRQARWVDFENDYKTMEIPYMESVLWAFSELYKKGYIYEGFKVMPYSWAAETVLSSSEIRLDDATREKEDKAVTVAFKLKERPEGVPEAENYYVLAWTTTPWTLPSNLALAVGAEMNYACVLSDDDKSCFLFAPASEAAYASMLSVITKAGFTTTATEDDDRCKAVLKGEALIDAKYEPLFPYFAGTKNAFRILDGSSFIEEGSGTGIVHMAPGFGEDDQRVCAENGIETIVPVDMEGRYTDAIYDLPNVPLQSDGVIETARCHLRPVTPDDLELIESINNNPEVAKTTYNGKQSPEQLQAYLDDLLETQAKYGVSQWLVFDKQSGALMGRAGLVYRSYPDMEHHWEISRALLPDFWSKGFGHELAEAWIHVAFAKLDIEALYVGSMSNNPKARYTQEKLGFHYERRMQVNVYNEDAEPGYIYTLTRKDYEQLYPPLSLRGLNVIKETKGKTDAEPYTDAQLEKYGLANLRIINWLKQRSRLIRQEDYNHNYPHCWRTDQPIIYMAMSSWFVDVPQFRDRMVELNQQINWIPEHIKDGRFGKWLENAREWSISRSRFWGCPIPVWRSDNPDNDELYVFGSIAELNDFFDADVKDLHRPYIDELTKPDPQNPDYTIRRVEDVFDCWFESGSMPYAQVHYPFENQNWFEHHFPAQFIVEYEAQTRGWFYNMMVLSVALFDRIPFENCICHGVVLDDSGRKLSKKLQNYMDPKALFEQYGSDALRWYMMSSAIMRGSELLLDPEGKFIHDAIRLYLKPIWNAWHFFTLYANADGVEASFSVDSANLMDRYILAKCAGMIEEVTAALDAYDTPRATQAITSFVEILNNWYIRRNKERFWNDRKDDPDKQAAYDTLYTVLHLLCRAASPLLPMLTEAVYRALTGEQSVHLADWPDVSAISKEADLVADMDRVRDACNTLLSIRSAENVRIRQPLAKATLYGAGAERLKPFSALISDEVNLKEVAFSNNLETVAEQKLTIHFPVAGKRLGPKMKAVAKAAKSGDWKREGDAMIVGGEALQSEEYTMQLVPKGEIRGAQPLSSNDALAILDLDVTPELRAEGTARDLVRLIQQARKDAGLQVSDRIALSLALEEAGQRAAIEAHRDYICEQTLAVSLALEEGRSHIYQHQTELDGAPIIIGFSLASKDAA